MPKRVPPCQFGELLDRLREEEEVPEYRDQNGMARKLGVSPSLLSLWRTGRREPKSIHIQRISQIYDVREDDIWFTLGLYRMPLESAISFQPPGLVSLEIQVTPVEREELMKYLAFLRIRTRLSINAKDGESEA
jgi:transcriptional regulator with XRE-family HTH domain